MNYVRCIYFKNMNWKKLTTFSQCINHIKVKKTVKLHTEEKGFDDSNRFLSFKRQVDILKKRIFFSPLTQMKKSCQHFET